MIKKLLFNKNLKIGSIYLIANVINKAIAFITIPIFTRLLSTGEYGIVSTYTSYVLILQYLMGFSSEYTIRNAYVDYKNEIDEYMASLYLLSFICSSIISAVIFVLNTTTLHITTALICICCLLQSFMTHINNVMIEKLMMSKEYVRRSLLMAMPNVLSVILGITFIIIMKNDKALGRIFGYVSAISAFGLYNLLNCFRHFKGKVKFEYWKYILKISPPMIFHGLSIVLLSQLDRIMITSLRNASETGIYSLIYSMSLVALALTNAINGVWIPWFTEMYENKRYKEINERAFLLLNFLAVLTLIIMFVAPEVIKFITPQEYWSGISMVPPLTLAAFITYAYTYYVGLELYEKRTKTISILTTIAALVNAGTNLLLIPKYGALAAAYTTLFSYIVLFFLHGAVSLRLNKNLFGIRIMLVPIIIAVSATILFYIAINLSLVRWIISITVFAFFAYNFLKKNYA